MAGPYIIVALALSLRRLVLEFVFAPLVRIVRALPPLAIQALFGFLPDAGSAEGQGGRI